jgi:hypothetical protein
VEKRIVVRVAVRMKGSCLEHVGTNGIILDCICNIRNWAREAAAQVLDAIEGGCCRHVSTSPMKPTGLRSASLERHFVRTESSSTLGTPLCEFLMQF